MSSRCGRRAKCPSPNPVNSSLEFEKFFLSSSFLRLVCRARASMPISPIASLTPGDKKDSKLPLGDNTSCYDQRYGGLFPDSSRWMAPFNEQFSESFQRTSFISTVGSHHCTSSGRPPSDWAAVLVAAWKLSALTLNDRTQARRS